MHEKNIEGLDLRNKTVFDCAIGAGEAAYWWAKAIDEAGGTSRIMGFDIELTPENRETIAGNLRGYAEYVELAERDITDFSGYPDASVDYINCDDTLVFLAIRADGIAKAFSEFHRLLKPDGRIFINSEIPVSWSTEPHMRNQFRRWNFAKAVYSFKGETWSVEPDLESVTSLAVSSGFEPEETRATEPFRQSDPSACVEEWKEIMSSDISALHVSEELKTALRTEMSSIAADIERDGMACPGYFTLVLRKPF